MAAVHTYLDFTPEGSPGIRAMSGRQSRKWCVCAVRWQTDQIPSTLATSTRTCYIQSETGVACDTLAVNLRAPFLLSKAAFPRMREVGGGIIVNISSVAGKKGWANASAYCASKFGLTGFTEAIADEGKEHGIRAIVLYPGAMATNWGVFSPVERQEGEPTKVSPTRVLPPERVADLIVWLAASPPEFVLTEGLVLPIEEGLP
jgi:NAD(P)-dependent dehydrogenase (short-subunit alcohol dehydrogenase family)